MSAVAATHLGWAALVTVLVVVAVASWVARENRFQRRCAEALAVAERAAARGALREALETIDRADAACRCERFTSGDEPPEHAAAREYVERLRAREGDAAVEEVLRRARGPLLRRLAAAEARGGGGGR